MPTGSFDSDLFDDVNSFARHTGWLRTPMYGVATYRVIVFGALLVAGWWMARARDPRAVAASVWAGAATLVAVALNQPLVNAFREARPYTDSHDILVLAHHSTDYGFPSDHAVMAGAAAAGLLLYSLRLGLIAAIAALLLAFSRVYIAAHGSRCCCSSAASSSRWPRVYSTSSTTTFSGSASTPRTTSVRGCSSPDSSPTSASNCLV